MATIPEMLSSAVGHHQAGHLPAAEQLYRQVLVANPNQADAWNLLGVVHVQRGRHDDGAECIRRALALRPGWAEAHYNLGWAYREQWKTAEAAACLRRAIELKPDYLEAHDALASVYQEQEKLDQAVALHRRTIELNPNYAAAYNNLGVTLAAQGRVDEGVASCRRALELKPDFPEAYNNLGIVLKSQGKLDEAVACYRRGLQCRPDLAELHNNLGVALAAARNLDEAVECHRRAIELKPDYAEAHANLGAAFKDRGQLDEAVACYRRALQLKPDYAEAQSDLLATLQNRDGVTLAELAAAHREFDRVHGEPWRGQWGRYDGVRDPARRLRVGFVSPDLGRHPVGYFLVGCLEHLDPGRCESVCYSSRVAKVDDMTARLRAAAALWRDVAWLGDGQLAEQIRSDRIDILFDLAGHTAYNRLLVFARKPAPIQVTWAGYVGTTGLAAMDYILANRYEIPPQAEAFYCERVLRMPDDYICYDPPGYAPAVSPLPAMESGHATLAAFHNPAKITPQVVAVWARILKRLPGARLLLKYVGMDAPSVRGRYAGLFAAHGIDASRLEFLGFSPHAEAMAEYRRVDVTLDTFPYSGGLTTCESLWMGAPVVTCPGETFAGRHSLSHLSNVGLTETIARDLDQYVETAAALAGDLPRLAALRAGLRERMAGSPLCDGKRFAENLMMILRGVWRDWCETT